MLKLFRFEKGIKEYPGVLFDGAYYDASSVIHDYDEAFFGGDGLALLKSRLSQKAALPSLDLAAVRLGPVVARPSKIIGIGLNYKDHAKETGAELPGEPKIFMKATTALCGSGDRLILPRGSQCTDYEVELAVVIGRRAKYVDEAHALEHVFGYTICNDYSERDYQKNRHGQFVKGKSADSFAPLGPFLVPKEQLTGDDLRLWLKVNGEMRQDSRTSEMVFGVAALVSCLSQYMTLLPGDVISTGTPSGVGLGRTPPCYLRPGDTVSYGIEGIGETAQKVVSYESTLAAARP